MKSFLFSLIFCVAAVVSALAQGPAVCPSSEPIGFGKGSKEHVLPTEPVVVTPPTGPTSGPDDKRMLYWIHGFQGADSSWIQQARATTDGLADGSYKARMAFSKHPHYIETSIPNAANHLQVMFTSGGDTAIGYDNDNNLLWNGVNTNIAERDRGINISHSQGGVVSRELVRRYDMPASNPLHIAPAQQRFKGLVTFGTPHNGVPALSNIGALGDLVSETACHALSGPIREFEDPNLAMFLLTAEAISPAIPNFLGVNVPAFGALTYWEQMGILTAGSLVYNYVNTLVPWTAIGQTLACNNGQGLDFVLSSEVIPIDMVLPMVLPGTAVDLQESSAVIVTLQGEDPANSSVPHRVAFYAVGQEPYLWREVFYTNNPASRFAPFTATGDQATVDEANAAADFMVARMMMYNDVVQGLSSPWWYFLSPTLTTITMNDAIDLREAWEESATWFLGIDEKYQFLIGAKSLDANPTYTWTSYTYANGQIFTNTMVTNSATSPFAPGIETTCSVNSVIISKPCDGLVLAQNAMDFPGLTHDPVQIPGQLDHQQMRNAAGTKGILNKLFNGDYDGLSGYFYTKKVE